jgi:imidazole glycerol-phosphate synthase subunit HisF
MLHPRIIPCLLVHNKGLVKTVRFGDPRYVGDPINAVKIFNEKEVDELMVLDIDATREGREPDYRMIEHLAVECRMPFCYGGGITSADQAARIFSLGVEKIALSAAAVQRPGLVTEIADEVGRQSVVVVMDVKKKLLGGYEVYTHNASRGSGSDPVAFAGLMESYGAGELVVNSIDRDGTMKGYDTRLIAMVREAVGVPMTVLGGCGSLDDIAGIIAEHGIIGVAAGSQFVFKGKYRAVLINYPMPADKEALIERSFVRK